MKIVVVNIFFAFFCVLSYAQAPNLSLQKTIQEFATSEGMENAAISFEVYSLSKDSILAEFNSKMKLPPASTTKLFTTAAALEILGKNFQPTTELYYYGNIDSLGILQGDIIIRGLGDPTLGSRFFEERDTRDSFLHVWTNYLIQQNIKGIEGKIIADGSAFGYHGVPDGWTWSDMGNYYGSGASACAIYDNMTFLHFSTSNTLNGKTHIDSMSPPIPGMEIDNRVTTYNSNSDNAYIYGTPFSNYRFAIGNLPRNRSNFEVKASIPDPELVLAQVFENALQKQNISVKYPAVGRRTIPTDEAFIFDYSKFKVLGIYKDKTIEDIVYWTNKRSVNFFAEQLLHLLAMRNGEANYKESIKFINQYWGNKLGIKMCQTDGSGLSRNNGFSSDDFIKLLQYMYHSKNFSDFENSLPVTGESGTLKSVARGQIAHGKIIAKTGTLNRVKSYAGYVNTISGEKLAFSITINNYDLSGTQLTKKIETLFNQMASY